MSEYHDTLERELERLHPPRIPFDQLASRRDRRRRDQRIRAGLLGIAIAIAVGWLGINAIRSSPPVPADPPTPTTPESWSRVPLDPPFDEGSNYFIAAVPGRLSVVAVHGGPATAWTSADGTAWTRTASEDLDGADLFDVRSGGPGFVATGSAVPEGRFERAIWTSADGISWSRLPDDPVFGDSFINAVGPGGPGLLAVGSRLGVWYSSDGSAWERASVPPIPPDVYPGDNGDAPQIYLTDFGESGGRLVAMGWAMLNDNSERVVVWTSRDGRSWTDVPVRADVFPTTGVDSISGSIVDAGSYISEITGGPDGFVAIGEANGTAAIWNSPDGRRWHLRHPGPDGVQLYSVAAGDDGYVAVGTTEECSTGCASREAVVMTSVDGETWIRLPSEPVFRVDDPEDQDNAMGAEMYSVVRWGSGYAAMGSYDGEPAVWFVETAP